MQLKSHFQFNNIAHSAVLKFMKIDEFKTARLNLQLYSSQN